MGILWNVCQLLVAPYPQVSEWQVQVGLATSSSLGVQEEVLMQVQGSQSQTPCLASESLCALPCGLDPTPVST